jgi:hypothetical protein
MKRVNKKYTINIPIPRFIKSNPTFFMPKKNLSGGRYPNTGGRVNAPIPYVKGGYTNTGYVVVE